MEPPQPLQEEGDCGMWSVECGMRIESCARALAQAEKEQAAPLMGRAYLNERATSRSG